MNKILETKNKTNGLLKKTGRKVSLSLHIMPQGHESSDTKLFSWLIAGLLILISLIIFLMLYV